MGKKRFEEPDLEVVELERVDVVCSSDDEGPCDDYLCNGYGTICTGGHEY